jgi:exopolysaccharide production protein ExoQ
MTAWSPALSATSTASTGWRAPSRERIDFVLACVTLAAFSGPGMMFLGLTDDPSAPPTPLLRLFWPPVYGLAILLLARRWRPVGRAWLAGLVMLAPALWAWATQFWSLAPDDTSRRGLALFMTTLFGVVLGAGFPGRTLVRIVAATLFWLALGSAATAVLMPRYGVEQVINQGCWRGLWDTKNALAAFMAVGAIAGAAAATLPGPGRRFWIAAFAACLFDLLMSRGKTSLVCLLLALVLLAVYHLGRQGPLRAVLVAWTAGAAGLWGGLAMLVKPELFFHAIGKDPTLTGRTEIWTALLQQVAERPVSGYGFGAFWNKESIPAKIIAAQTGWAAPEAHNAWLDLLAQVGGVGIVLAGLGCLIGLALAFRPARRDDGMFASVYVVSFLGLTMAESVLLSPNSLVWAAFVAVVVNLMGSSRRFEAPAVAGVAPTCGVAG